MKAFKPGQSIHFTVTATLLDVLTDPVSLTLTVHSADGSLLTPPSQRDGLGQYHADAALPLGAKDGIWSARWQAQGSDPSQTALIETRFQVQPLDY